MKHYIGTKEVMAEPMTEAKAIVEGYARENEDGHKFRLGYHVQYTNPDGTKYDSWSPRDVFEHSYYKSETFLDRMIIEASELHKRIRKLEEFNDSDKFHSLTRFQKNMLCSQLSAMRDYFRFLNVRIDDLRERDKDSTINDKETMPKFRNFTPHTIVLNDGRTFESEGMARVTNDFTEFDKDDVCSVVYGDVTGLPAEEPGTKYIVSAMVLAASDRPDLVAPATGHPQCVRNEEGFIVSVPGFVRR